eukprot:6254470-Pyramimonas_sp.AAC.1
MSSNRLRAMSKSSADALDNLRKASNISANGLSRNTRSKAALADCAFINSQPGTVPSWSPDNASAQPPARHEPYFQYLEPLKLRFIDWLKHEHGDTHPTAAQWRPLIWTPDLDQFARRMRCSALAVCGWEQ